MEIREFLLETGNLPNLKGFHCLIKAVEIVKNSDFKLKLCKDLYPEVAKTRNMTPSQAERAMRHIIHRISEEDYRRIGLNRTPTVGEFICYFADGGQDE